MTLPVPVFKNADILNTRRILDGRFHLRPDPGTNQIIEFALAYTAMKYGQGLQANDLQAGEPGSAEYYFHQTGLPHFILDLRKASDKVPASAWLTRAIDFRSIGALAFADQFSANNLHKAFDAVIYFDKTTPSVLLVR